MKIDRFVKVMLVLIALLLALNCVSNLSNSSGSGSNVSSSPGTPDIKTSGSSRTPLIEKKVEAAPPPQTQYKVLYNTGIYGNPSVAQVQLNQASAEGWEFIAIDQGVLIFKK